MLERGGVSERLLLLSGDCCVELAEWGTEGSMETARADELDRESSREVFALRTEGGIFLGFGFRNGFPLTRSGEEGRLIESPSPE